MQRLADSSRGVQDERCDNQVERFGLEILTNRIVLDIQPLESDEWTPSLQLLLRIFEEPAGNVGKDVVLEPWQIA